VISWRGLLFGQLRGEKSPFFIICDGGRGTIRGHKYLMEEMLGDLFAMEVASYGSPLYGKTLLLHVIAICLRIGPNHPCLP